MNAGHTVTFAQNSSKHDLTLFSFSTADLSQVVERGIGRSVGFSYPKTKGTMLWGPLPADCTDSGLMLGP